MKVMTFIREILSVIITPFVLGFSLPRSAPAIVDFFREFTVHIDSLGYVCSFAIFDFKRHGNVNVSFFFAYVNRSILTSSFFLVRSTYQGERRAIHVKGREDGKKLFELQGRFQFST